MTSMTQGAHHRARATAVAIAAALLTTTGLVGPARASENGPSATGSGHFDLNGELRTFTFNAVTHQDGTVTGQAQLDARAIGFSEHIQINCLRLDGHTAYMSGTILRSSIPQLVGGTGRFSVQDNGEGANDPPDQLSRLNSIADQPADPDFCRADTEPLSPNIPLAEGNVQIHQ